MLTRLEEWIAADRPARARALESTLDRIRSIDPMIRAWVAVDPQPQIGDGPLAGVPAGIKDVIETRGLVTEYGSPIYKGRRGSEDAAIVRDLQARGAIMIGKTEAAAFAFKTPPPTRNPRDPDHTPGGSSSGSAAAVAADMVPVAVGTQTLGSMLRPASYCGVVGFKPTYGLLPIDGVLPVAQTLDTLGFFTHTPTGMLALWKTLGHATARDEDVRLGFVEPRPDVEPPMAAAFEAAIARLRQRGFDLEPVPIAPMLDTLDREARVVMAYEAAQAHGERYREHGDRLLDLADLVRDGLRTSADRYRAALQTIAVARTDMVARFQRTPVVLSPAATGPAPHGLGSTGDARMNSPWTALGTPAISIPMPVQADALPLGLQLTAARGDDGRVLRTAIRVSTALADRPEYNP